MSQERSKDVNSYRQLKNLRSELFRVSKELRGTKDKTTRKELESRVNDLKIELGWNLMDCGDYHKGLALYTSLPWRAYEEVKCNGMSRALVELGLHDEAGRLLEKGLKKFPESYCLWVGMGAFHAALGRDFEALECFDTAVRVAPENNSVAFLNKAQVLTKIGCYGDALTILKDLIQRDSHDLRALLEAGYCHLEMGHPEDALQFYQKAMEVWKNDPMPYEGGCLYMGLYAAYRAQGMLKEAMAIAKEGLRRFPEGDAGLYQNLSDAYYAMGWRGDALRVLKKGIEKFPKDEELKKVLKDIDEETDDPEDGQKPPLLGLILLASLIYRKFQKK
jgi:tetratricopeptide (TPR) repeat protein